MAISNDKFRNPITSPDKAKKKGTIDKEAFQRSFENYMKNSGQGGFSGVWNPMMNMGVLAKTRNNAADKGPPNDKFLHPESATDKKPPEKPQEPLPPAIRPVSNRWNDIVGAYFPATGGNVYKDGGLVRGGGKAQRGVGRGKMR